MSKGKKIINGIIWIIWWSLKGSIMVGILTKKIKDKKKRDFVVIAFDIALIIVFIWWALGEKTGYEQGVKDCANVWCEWLPNATGKFCPDNYSMFGNGKIINQSDFLKEFTKTGTELPKGWNST